MNVLPSIARLLLPETSPVLVPLSETLSHYLLLIIVLKSSRCSGGTREKLPLPIFNRRIIKIIPALYGARWLLNKDIVRGTNSYPLKDVVGENRTRPIPLSPFVSLRDKRMDEDKDQGYDVDKRRDGIGDYRLRDYNGLEGFETNDFPRAGMEVQRKGGRWLKATEKEEWLLLALRRILIELLAAFLSLLSHARAALSVFGFV